MPLSNPGLPSLSATVRPISRRSFFPGVLFPGVACMTAGLATGVQVFAPDWGERTRPAQPVSAPAQVTAALPVPAVHTYSAGFRREWEAFKHRFVTPEGRVLDTGNGNSSHSEGQGWSLLAAQAAGDAQTFATILNWTTQTLQIRPYDALHAWRYRPGDAKPVADLNNATDGDIFIAAALARAAVRWQRPDYAARAARIAGGILSLIRLAGARTVLLPAAFGFEHPDSVIINPSYYAFALFADLAAVAPSPQWALLRQEGTALMLQARFGRWGLPPDWLQVQRKTGALSIAAGWQPRFSYDAIRVPLHIAWGAGEAAPLLDGFTRYWTASPARPPAWTDLVTGQNAEYAAPLGIHAVANLVLSLSNPLPPRRSMDRAVVLPSVTETDDYYGAGLVLLCRIAAEERGQQAV